MGGRWGWCWRGWWWWWRSSNHACTLYFHYDDYIAGWSIPYSTYDPAKSSGSSCWGGVVSRRDVPRRFQVNHLPWRIISDIQLLLIPFHLLVLWVTWASRRSWSRRAALLRRVQRCFRFTLAIRAALGALVASRAPSWWSPRAQSSTRTRSDPTSVSPPSHTAACRVAAACCSRAFLTDESRSNGPD
jgi:hypothetical protein